MTRTTAITFYYTSKMMTVLTIFTIQFRLSSYFIWIFSFLIGFLIYILYTFSNSLYSVFCIIYFYMFTYLILFPAHKRYDEVSFGLFRKFIDFKIIIYGL